MITTKPLIQKAKDVSDSYFKEKNPEHTIRMEAFIKQAFDDIGIKAYQEGLQQVKAPQNLDELHQLKGQVEELKSQFEYLLQQISTTFEQEGSASSSIKSISDRSIKQHTELESLKSSTKTQQEKLHTLQQSFEKYVKDQTSIEKISQQVVDNPTKTQNLQLPSKTPKKDLSRCYIKTIVQIPYPTLFAFIFALVVSHWGLEESKKYLPKEALNFPFSVFSISLKGMCIAAAIFLVIKCFSTLLSIQSKDFSKKSEKTALEKLSESIFFKAIFSLACVGIGIYCYKKKNINGPAFLKKWLAFIG